MVNLNLYKIFKVVVEEKKISKASEKLYISQPAVSFAIKELEKSLDQVLFIRKSKGVELTTFGTMLYNKIGNVINIFDEAEVDAQNYTMLNEGMIRIGANSGNINQILLEYLTTFAKKYPNIKITMIRASEDKLIEKLNNNELDMAFVDKINNVENFEIVKHYSVKYQLLGNSDFKKKYPQDNVEMSNFPTSDLILPSINNNSRVTINNFFLNSGIELHPKYELDNYVLLYEFVKRGFGIAFVNTDYYKDSVKSGDTHVIFPDFSINAREFVCIVNTRHTNNALDKCIEIVKEK